MTNYIDTQVKESILDDMVELYTQANILAHNKIREYGRLEINDPKYEPTRKEINILTKKMEIYANQYPALPYHFKFHQNMAEYRATQ
jgi:hypothetical protein